MKKGNDFDGRLHGEATKRAVRSTAHGPWLPFFAGQGSMHQPQAASSIAASGVVRRANLLLPVC